MKDSKIQVSREKAIINQARSFEILINGEPKMAVANGGNIGKELKPGKYQIQAKMGWKQSDIKQVEIGAGDVLNIKVANRNSFYYANIVKFLLFFIISVSVVFGDLDKMFLTYTLLLAGLHSVLEFTWFKNKHIVLEQIKI